MDIFDLPSQLSAQHASAQSVAGLRSGLKGIVNEEKLCRA
jgi:hypothetical protein